MTFKSTFRTALTTTMLAVAMAAPSSAHAGTEYRITGHGWGHGIGMSQYGAQGYATKAGWSYDQIIRHYFQGTNIGQLPGDAGVMDVELVSGRSAVTLEAMHDGLQVAGGGSVTGANRGELVVVRIAGNGLEVTRTGGGATSTGGSNVAGPVSVSSPTGALAPVRGRFRADGGAMNHRWRGTILVYRVGRTISVINRVPMDEYLLGVVPAEMPTSWHPEALKAQAVAARSYAVATRKATGIYDAHADTRSQVYRGLEEEEPPTTAAVQATAGQVAMHSGSVIPAFFFSTSGGRTASIEDVWGSAPRPYLKSVADPYEKSPYSTWPEHVAYGPKGMQGKLSGYVKGKLRGITVTTNKSRRAGKVTIVGTRGSATMSPGVFQYRLGLRSTWFRVEKLQLDATATRVRRGAKVKLVGFAPRGGRTMLQRRPAGGQWATVGRVRAGSWTQRVRVRSTTQYRLFRGRHAGPGVTLRVA